MDKQILKIDDTFEAINIIYFGSAEEVGISIYDKRTTNGACGYLTFKEFEKMVEKYQIAKEQEIYEAINELKGD